jgi:UDP-4-amino-4,6-dideoxy-N-acetyl-beta-L-altrosamine N-acetyltransferase
MNITLRKIQDKDLETIMYWRMAPDITRYMNTNPKLTMESQRKWLASINENDAVMYWVIENNLKPIGLINLADIDWKNKTSLWGYYIGEKSERSFKLALSLEMSLYDYVFDVLDFNELHGEIFSLNEGVIKLHLLCGSHITKEVNGEVEKEGVKYDVTHMSITKEKWNEIRFSKKYEKINFNING